MQRPYLNQARGGEQRELLIDDTLPIAHGSDVVEACDAHIGQESTLAATQAARLAAAKAHIGH